MELCTADAGVGGEALHVEVGVGQVFVDRLHDALHELLVCALDLHLVAQLLLAQGPGELSSQPPDVADEFVDEHVELFHVERFGQEGVGTLAQAFQAVAHLCLRGEQHHRYVAHQGVRLDVLEQSYSVHLWHDDVGHHQVVVALEQCVEGLLAVLERFDVIPMPQLAFDVCGHFVVVVHHHHPDVGVGFHVFAGFCCLLFHRLPFHLFRLEVAVAQGDLHLQAGTRVSVGAVVCLDGASVHLHDGLADVEAQSRPADVVGALVEAFEEFVGVLACLEADAAVGHFDDGVRGRLFERDFYLAVLLDKLEGVGEQVGDHFVEVGAVNPCREFGHVVLEGVAYSPLLCIELEEGLYSGDESHQVGLPAVQVHLVLVDFPFVEDLVDKEQQPLGVAVHGVDVLYALGVSDFLPQFFQRPEDEGERRAYVVGGVDEEAHLLLLCLLLAFALHLPVDEEHDGRCDEEVCEVCPPCGVPGVLHDDGVFHGFLRCHPVVFRHDFDDILSRVLLVEGDAVAPFFCRRPLPSVDPVEETYVVGVLEGEQRELHGERVVLEGDAHHVGQGV